MSTRALQILSRFPAHFDAVRPGKQLSVVAEQLSVGLDLLSTDLAEVRRAHRLAHADTIRDLRFLGGLHGIGPADFDVLRRKKTRLLELCDQLDRAIEEKRSDDRDSKAGLLLDLFAVDARSPRLARFVPPPRTDLDGAAKRLSGLVRTAVAFHGYLEALRARVQTICQSHQEGNATVRAIIAGAANALDLELDEAKNRAARAALLKDPAAAAEMETHIDDGLFHSKDLFWHSTFVKDRMALPPPLPDKKPLPVLEEVLGIEENPLRREYWPLPTGEPPVHTPRPTVHAELFYIQRRGFGRELLQISVTGVGDRTVGPMLVNRDEGRGIGWFGTVPDGKILRFTEDGRALLDGADVTANAYSWRGACFTLPKAKAGEPSDDTTSPPHDFVFDGPALDRYTKKRVAKFAVASPRGALDREGIFPHGGENVEAPGIGIGRTRLAFFVQEAHLSGDRLVTPHPVIGFAGDRAMRSFTPLITEYQ